MRVQTIQLHCDFCGYGGAHAEPEDFVAALGGGDLCRWCADPAYRAWIESGGHRISFDGDTWICDCGASHESTLFRHRYTVLIDPNIVDAVPRIANATAHVHLERR